MNIMSSSAVQEAFDAESIDLLRELATLTPADFARPTNCPPWAVRDMLAHLRTAVARTLDMLAGPEPATAGTDAAGYYRPDRRFDPAVDAARVATAISDAARTGDRALVEQLATACRDVHVAADRATGDRRVTTRHGDTMTLTDFLATRVVELAVHGLDLALSLDRPPWTTPAARRVVLDLVPADARAYADTQAWDEATFLAKATGRTPLTAVERDAARRAGVRRLALSP